MSKRDDFLKKVNQSDSYSADFTRCSMRVCSLILEHTLRFMFNSSEARKKRKLTVQWSFVPGDLKSAFYAVNNLAVTSLNSKSIDEFVAARRDTVTAVETGKVLSMVALLEQTENRSSRSLIQDVICEPGAHWCYQAQLMCAKTFILVSKLSPYVGCFEYVRKDTILEEASALAAWILGENNEEFWDSCAAEFEVQFVPAKNS